jgi:hypothetical protein
MSGSFDTSSVEDDGFGNGANGFGRTFEARDALVVADGFHCVHGDVHRAQDRARAIGFAGGFHAADLEYAE